jgi:Skp family chaperone for outer membrane proteins
MKALFLAGILTLVPLSASAQTPFGLSGLRVAFFSPQRAFSESPEGKTGITRLKELQEKSAREIEARNKALQSREQALEQSLGILNQETRDQRTRELEKFRLDVQRFIQDAQANVLDVQRDIESAFTIRLKPALEAVAKANKLQLILNLDTEALLWADPALDITADVVKQLARADSPPQPRFE